MNETEQENHKLEHILELKDRLMPLVSVMLKSDSKKAEAILAIVNELLELYHQEIRTSYRMWELVKQQDDQLFAYFMEKAYGFTEKELKTLDHNLKFAFDHEKKITIIKKYQNYVH